MHTCKCPGPRLMHVFIPSVGSYLFEHDKSVGRRAQRPNDEQNRYADNEREHADERSLLCNFMHPSMRAALDDSHGGSRNLQKLQRGEERAQEAYSAAHGSVATELEKGVAIGGDEGQEEGSEAEVHDKGAEGVLAGDATAGGKGGLEGGREAQRYVPGSKRGRERRTR
jgi:hypothetical protein